MKKMGSSELKQAILGMMWGDAYVDFNAMSGKARLDIYHCENQLPLLEWKKNILEQVTNVSCRITEKTDKRILLDGKTRKGFRLQTNFCTYLGKLYQLPRKFILKQLVKPLALSILWQDDGTLVFCKKGYYSTANLCTDNWDKDDVFQFKLNWNKLYGWCPSMQEYSTSKVDGKVQFRLRFQKEEAIKLSCVIKQYILPCLSYKIFNT